MTEELSDRDTTLFERVLVGEVEATGTLVRERRRASPELDRALDEWKQLEQHLQPDIRAGNVIARARAEMTAVDRQVVRAALESGGDLPTPATRDRSPTRERPSGTSLRIVLALAASVALVWIGLRLAGFGAGSEPRTNGAVELLSSSACVRPVGPVAAYAPFELDVELQVWWTVEFVVYDGAGNELLRSAALDTASWNPTEKERERLDRTDAIRWEFTVQDAGGASMLSGEGHASLSP